MAISCADRAQPRAQSPATGGATSVTGGATSVIVGSSGTGGASNDSVDASSPNKDASSQTPFSTSGGYQGLASPAEVIDDPASSPRVVIKNSLTTATDGLGRTLPGWDMVGSPRPSHWVGMFYWQWHQQTRAWTSYNVTDWLHANPGYAGWTSNPPGGPGIPEWYWAQPLYGYYQSADPWVIRKHLVALADLGVDFLFFDYTNASVYDPEMQAMLDVAEDLIDKGVAVPRFTFFLNYQPTWKVAHVYDAWYSPGRWDNVWFKWQGKPLLLSPAPTTATPDGEPPMANPSELGTIQNYFTYQTTWAFTNGAPPTEWQFMDNTPQYVALDSMGHAAQMPVSKSLGAPVNNNMVSGCVSCVYGQKSPPTFDDQFLTPQTPQGLFYAQQWENAKAASPPIVMVTGWNEWTAAVWTQAGVPFLGAVTDDTQGHFVDEFNQEFDRDLEPTGEGYGDAFYWQTAAEMRRYKGMDQTPGWSIGPVVVDGNFNDWANVKPVYTDPIGDTAKRDFDGSVPNVHYTDNSARNDLATAQVSWDAASVYFYVSTASPLSASSGAQWMLLLIDADSNPATGWNGYDVLVNRSRTTSYCSLEKFVGASTTDWSWQQVTSVPIAWANSGLELSIPRAILGVAPSPAEPHFQFKWADNIPASPSILDFWSAGDVAPNARFNFVR
jgi:hypothetical protein